MSLNYPELDWPGVLRLAGRFCSTERGLERLLASTPSPDAAEVARRQGLARDLLARRGLRPPVPLGGLDEVVPLLARLGPSGLALPPEELLDLFGLAERSDGARHAVPVPGLDLPVLSPFLAPLPSFDDLLAERDATFEPDGRVKDTASMRLSSVRSAIVRLRRELVRRLEDFARAHADVLSEGYVTEKNGRYCVPVRADRKEGVAGIVHEKSGSGQTLFVEPLAVVEANNSLAEALEEEREEVHRILVAATARLAARRGDLLSAAEILTELDAAEARAEFSSKSRGVFPESGGRVVLRGARHPLLDRALAPLREEVFGERVEERHADAVPLGLEVPADRHLVLISGPNAGGKTVAMKTLGLFALLHQTGFALPAEPGTTLPVFDRILVVAGDAQDLLGDLSSFEAAMTRTAAVLAAAGPESLVLLDEVGSGTDSDEGAALAIGILESDRRRQGLTVATTHLNAVKEWARAQPDILSAAMEFDEGRARPTYRIRMGAIGRSRALSVAERAGLPAAVLTSARARLGSRWAEADAALARLEAETLRAKDEAERSRALAETATARLAEAERERADLAAERARLREKGRGEVERALEALRERVRRELDRVREEAKAGRAISRGALTGVIEAARESALGLFPDEDMRGSVLVGDLVRVRPYRTVGRLVALHVGRREAEVEVRGKRMRVALSSLAPAAEEVEAAGRKSAAGVLRKESAPVSVILVGQRVDPALREVERAINDGLLTGRPALRIVHGHGTGRLGSAIREFLETHPGVSSHRPGSPDEGGNAVTMALLDV